MASGNVANVNFRVRESPWRDQFGSAPRRLVTSASESFMSGFYRLSCNMKVMKELEDMEKSLTVFFRLLRRCELFEGWRRAHSSFFAGFATPLAPEDCRSCTFVSIAWLRRCGSIFADSCGVD